MLSTPELALNEMLRHAAINSPYYSSFDWAARIRKGIAVSFNEIPITPKGILKSDTPAFYARNVPAEDGQIIEKMTSGSGGEPSRILKTQKHFHINRLECIRLRQSWPMQGIERTLILSTPNPSFPEFDVIREKNGQAVVIKIRANTAQRIIEFIDSFRPQIVSSFPLLVTTLFEARRSFSTVRYVRTIGSMVDDHLRSMVNTGLGRELIDSYGSKETGIMASQCRACGGYHLADQHVRLEILDEKNVPVLAGNIGRNIVTPLYNKAMPIIRYEIGDLLRTAAIGSLCRFGSNVVSSIEGRTSHRFTLPNGQKIMPKIVARTSFEMGIKYVKLKQISLREVELHYIPRAPDFLMSQEQAQYLLSTAVSAAFLAIPVRVESLEMPSGKYLEHESIFET